MFLRVIKVQVFAFSYCSQSNIINDMDDEVFAVYTFFMCILVKVEVFAFSKCFLRLHEIVEGLYFHCSLSVCLCVCVCVCLSVCVSGTSCEQSSSRLDAPIFTRFSLNGCLAHWLGPY